MKKERMIIAFLSLLFLLPGCKEEKTQSVFDADEFDCVGWPHIRKVTITNVNCEAEGIFLILEDSFVIVNMRERFVTNTCSYLLLSDTTIEISGCNFASLVASV